MCGIVRENCAPGMGLQTTFPGEVAAAMEDLHQAHTVLRSTQDQLAEVQQEVQRLQAQCNEFVRRNLDHMLVHRNMQARTDSLEGQERHELHCCAPTDRCSPPPPSCTGMSEGRARSSEMCCRRGCDVESSQQPAWIGDGTGRASCHPPPSAARRCNGSAGQCEAASGSACLSRKRNSCCNHGKRQQLTHGGTAGVSQMKRRTYACVPNAEADTQHADISSSRH